jgi:plastocyanin
MLVTRGVTMILVILAVAACGSSTSTSVANSCGSSGAAANINTASSNVFSPSAATIAHGQAVCWQNSSSVSHTVTADNGAFNTSLPVGQIFVYTYSTAGSYPYHCTIHAGMTGTITVT